MRKSTGKADNLSGKRGLGPRGEEWEEKGQEEEEGMARVLENCGGQGGEEVQGEGDSVAMEEGGV